MFARLIARLCCATCFALPPGLVLAALAALEYGPGGPVRGAQAALLLAASLVGGCLVGGWWFEWSEQQRDARGGPLP